MEVSATIYSCYGDMDFHLIEVSKTFYLFNDAVISFLGVMYPPLFYLYNLILTILHLMLHGIP